MICTDCKVAKESFCFWRSKNGGGSGMRPCLRCKGSGEVSDQMGEWIAKGRLMRDARVARGESLYEAGKRLGIGSAALSSMEVGRTEPKP